MIALLKGFFFMSRIFIFKMFNGTINVFVLLLIAVATAAADDDGDEDDDD